MRRTVLSLIAIVSIASLPNFALAKSAHPDATVSLSGKSVAAGVGYSWGKGTLHYKGKSYPFSVDGLSVGDVGVSSITATGNVYHLKKVDDFTGQYTAAAAGAAVGGGGAIGTMKNANGVVMDLKATTRGVKLTAGVEGIKVSIEK
jgi:hypothetical protein